MELQRDYVTVSPNKRYYIDITTNGINTTTGVSGTNDSFTCNIETLELSQNYKWTAEIVSWYYKNVNIGPGVYPILQADFVENIRIDNTNASIIMKSTAPATDTNYQERFLFNNPILTLDVGASVIRNISFSIVRSDNGQPFGIDNASIVHITLLIKN